ncbi:MAG TPA: rhodanese-like domain-containing protein [Novosphingobium sp.]
MKLVFTSLMLPLVLAALPAAAQERATNPQFDYAGFSRLVEELGPVREAHRLPWSQFAARARAEGAILLDARSASAFARGHLKGAINLPFSDFSAETLREALGADTGRPIYIYCNNNFRDHRPPVILKAAPLALNIPTFVNLHGYGYTNVWELADLIGTTDAGVEWVASEGAEPAGAPPLARNR